MNQMPTAGRLLAVLAAVVAAATTPRAEDLAPTLRITSPLGRTGLPATIRIVARLDALTKPTEVRFYVDKKLLHADTDGPPYDALWVDENPFDPTELSVEAEFASGPPLRDALDLKPLEVTESVDVASVLVDATVLDDTGRFVPNLSAADFELFENTTRESVDLVREDLEPALFTLLIDSSQSMATQAGAIRKMAVRLLGSLREHDQVVVAPFSNGVLSVTGPTVDRQTALDAIAAIKPSGSTAILDSIRQVALSLRAEQSRHAIVLITDGYDERSELNADGVVEALREHHTSLYALGVGGIAGISLKGEALLSRLAERTGGRAWFPRDAHRLADAYGAIANDFSRKYFITYTPSNQRRDSTWRAIDVRVNRPGLRVRARSGYTAPAAPPVRASLEFTAVGAGDTPVSLTADQIVVRENGVPQTIDTFQEAVLPVTIMLALDSSGSMKKSAARAQEAARDFVLATRPEDQIGTITFADRSQYVHDPTTLRTLPLSAIDAYTADGGTALYDALYDALERLGGIRDVRRVVVVVTDGRDEDRDSNGPGSLRAWDDVLSISQRTEATVYAVGIGSRVDRARLQDLADRTGGAAYFPTDVATLSADYARILDELRRRYVVGYESINRSRDGAWRPVDISAGESGVAIRSRGGYFAPEQ
ncbi:MAG: VWA domain-containing protein [Vicinamibacterales bacterium]